ncbi:Sugar transferase involved in LPS biosynthesis (colanic, teichoic acid) [Rhizobiales bacterium GAS191]|nr:Sugar transferase involved in LPS biosynthesis (colanic, teichoic acid) [Rhizobiales bacterium GAS113]SEE85530.1 Sugar transferase involved in LPS biosynthesis (colanic, teichoic acid) [Rhizobiales bacterium GAS191]
MSLVQSARPVKLETRATAAPSPTRILDLAVASAGLLILGPLMLLVALAIYVTEGRPIFFSQVRLGLRGCRFRMHKFRKFHSDCGPNCRPVTLKNDARLTRLGSLLERTKLDELPQLWNILKGDMSIVGPRPESLDLAGCFTEPYLRVLDYKPGIFGPNQVHFRNEGSLYSERVDPEHYYRDVLFPIKARADLAYFPHRTLWSDIGWIIRGVLSVFGSGRPPVEILETYQAVRIEEPPSAGHRVRL